MFFSLIVPVYNRKKTISRCIDSILKQRYKKYEIIIIDDGSCDGSELICEDYASKNERIKIYHQGNQGVSVARNIGIKMAEGDYILFIDSDDMIPENYLLNISKAFQEYGDNVVYCTSIKFISNRRRQLSRYSHLKYSCVGIKDMTIMMNAGLFNSAVNKVYRKKILVEYHIKFTNKINLGEDLLFNLKYLDCVSNQKLLFLNHTYYIVDTADENSLERKWRDDYYEIQVVLLKKCLKYLSQWEECGKWNCNVQEYLRLKRNLYDICINGSLLYYKSFWGKKPYQTIIKKGVMIRRSPEYAKYLRLKRIICI